MKHPISNDKMHQTPPLLVMNNFTSTQSDDATLPSVPRHLESLTTTIFQSLFPAISPQSTPLSSIRRVMLLNRELVSKTTTGAYTINVRHYAITTKRTGLAKSVRKINAAERIIKNSSQRSGMPNLNKLEDVADYILDPSATASGFTSGSETEAETDAEVEVLNTSAKKMIGRKKAEAMQKRGEERNTARNVEKKAVKLVELGPRLRLRMTKVEEGVCSGKIMWHEYISKTREEEKEQDLAWEQKRKEKEERKRIQKENVEKKQQQKKGNKNETDETLNEMDQDEWDSDELMDDNDGYVGGEEEEEVNGNESNGLRVPIR